MILNRHFLTALFLVLAWSSSARSQECSNWLARSFWQSAEPEEVQACLTAGRSLEERTSAGETPLHLAAAVSSSETVLTLLRAGADVSLTTAGSLTPLHVAARDTLHGVVISHLLVWGSDVNKRIPPDSCGYIRTCADSALHLAADRADAAPVLSALLSGGADPSLDDTEGREPLQRAMVNAGLSEIEILLKSGASVDATDLEGNTALHELKHENPDEFAIAKALIAAGASVDAKRDDGVTPLISASYYTVNPRMFELLLSHSEDPCHVSKGETTALMGHEFNEALEANQTYWRLHEQCSQD